MTAMTTTLATLPSPIISKMSTVQTTVDAKVIFSTPSFLDVHARSGVRAEPDGPDVVGLLHAALGRGRVAARPPFACAGLGYLPVAGAVWRDTRFRKVRAGRRA